MTNHCHLIGKNLFLRHSQEVLEEDIVFAHSDTAVDSLTDHEREAIIREHGKWIRAFVKKLYTGDPRRPHTARAVGTPTSSGGSANRKTADKGHKTASPNGQMTEQFSNPMVAQVAIEDLPDNREREDSLI
jgi:hypothetical protein